MPNSRASVNDAEDGPVLERGFIALRGADRRIFIDGRPIAALAPKEFALLRELVTQTPRAVSKRDLALSAWGCPLEDLHQRTLDVHVRRIRRKIGPAAGCLRTVPSTGYQWIGR